MLGTRGVPLWRWGTTVADGIGSRQRACGLPRQPVSTGPPCVHRLSRHLDCGEVQIGPLDNPRGRRHHLARWQCPLPDEPLDHCLTDL